MERYESLQDFLQQNGVNSQTAPSEIDSLKKSYWRAKRKAYYQDEKGKTKRINLTLSNKEYRLVEQSARLHKQRVSVHARTALLAKIQKTSLIQNEETLYDLIAEINAIGNNINQVVHKMHALQAYRELEAYQQLLAELRKYQHKIENHIKHPPDLYTALEEDLTQHPDREKKVLAILHKVCQESKNTEHDHQE